MLGSFLAKVTAIEESKDLTSLSLDELIRNLKVHEMIIKKDSKIVKAKVERKSLALKAKKESSDEECSTSGSEDEEYAMAVREKRWVNQNHLIEECPKPPKDKNQRAFVGGSWSDSGKEDDEKVKNETCLVAQASSEICLGVDLEPDEWIKDSGCSKHMTGNRKLFSSYKAYNGGNVIFGSNLRGNIIGKGQICDNKCRVTFSEHDSEITKDGKVIGRGIRKKGLYVMKLGNKPKDKICLATIDENSTLWHRRLGHANMRLIQSLASKELVRNLPKLKFDQHFCDACKIGKQAHASHKAKNIVSTTRCLELLHMDLFGPSAVRSYGGNRYTLVIVDDYSSFVMPTIDEDEGITLVQMSAQTQGRHEHDFEEPDFKFIALEEDYTAEPDISTTNVPISTAGAEVSIASPEVKTTAKSLVYIRRSAAKRKDKGKAIMKEVEPVQKKTKLQLEQERLGLEEALRLKEQLDEEERQRIARVHEEASTFNDEEWNNIQAQIEVDEELAHRLQAQERERYSEADKARLLIELRNERKRKFAQQRAEQRRNKPMTQAQQKDLHLFETTMKRVNTFTPMESDDTVPKVVAGSSKIDAKQLMIIVPEEGMNVEALQTKYPIIDWEVYTEDSRKYWKIIRVGNHTEVYQIFKDMLKNFDRDNLVKLWSLVHKRFNSTEPTEDKERELWVELKRLFEPDDDDTLWKLQRYMHDPLKWRLYDTCVVHHVSTKRGHDIFMLVEKNYPLTRALMTLMLNNKLQVDEYSVMADEILRKIFILASIPRQGGLLGIKGFYNFVLLVQLSTAMRRLSTVKLSFDSNEEEVVPKGDDVSLVDRVFYGAFDGDGKENFVMGEGVVVSSSSLDMFTKSCLGGMMWKKSEEDDCEDGEDGEDEDYLFWSNYPNSSLLFLSPQQILDALSEPFYAHLITELDGQGFQFDECRMDERRMVDRRRMRKKWKTNLFSCHNPFRSFALVEWQEDT
ncbi:retrovirus-related pol polyprotein from transposon TNT 1-94 [Tanacetum coccineum]